MGELIFSVNEADLPGLQQATGIVFFMSHTSLKLWKTLAIQHVLDMAFNSPLVLFTFFAMP
jgi:hypothetical protein